ncbi:carbohydrate porin [Roseimicrobium gellanilyticum]|nr:carbohydrate porin [Roseimicrobium gellanilyticum]
MSEARIAPNPMNAKLVALLGICTFGSSSLLAQESPEMVAFRKQIESQLAEMKSGYEGRIKELEGRIGVLETDNARLKKNGATASNGPTKKANEQMEDIEERVTTLETLANHSDPQFQATAKRAQANSEAIAHIQQTIKDDATESREIFRSGSGKPFDLAAFYKLPQPFEFHGYLRAGFGLNGEGGEMDAFKAPGAGAKYRLGNEEDTYGELEFTHNWLREDDPLQAPYVRTTVMMSFSTGQNDTYDSLNAQNLGNDIALRQAFVEAGNIITEAPDMRFWVGQRYYRRQDIHINDFYWLDMSGYGGGVQDVPFLGESKVALAWLGGSFDEYQTDDGNAAKSTLDLRVYDIPAPLGKIGFWLAYAHSSGGEVLNVFDENGDRFSLETSQGFAVGMKHRTLPESFLGGYNEFSIQYGTGAAYNFASTIDVASPDIDDATRFRITDHFTIEPNRWLSLQAAAIYQDTDYGGPNSSEKWASFGVRPIFHFTDTFSIALETGVDFVDSEPLGVNDYLWKITLAPQLTRGRKFFSRPALRAFITYAKWGDDFRGKVGGSAYRNELEGLSYGVQLESWW